MQNTMQLLKTYIYSMYMQHLRIYR